MGIKVDSLQSLAKEIRDINEANGWNLTVPTDWADPYKVPAVLSLIHSEVSEALEAFRKDDAANFEEELADVLIRLLDLAGGICQRFDDVVASKLEVNRNRAHKHGGKRI
jgi:NTP pyrophosphatase (non-canonical NTP hydrolase)